MQLIWLEYRNAFRNITRQYRRSLFGVSAVAFGVVALTLAAGFIEWVLWATGEGTIQSGVGHVHVVRKGYLDDGQADPLKYLLPQDSALEKAVDGFPMVRVATPRLAFTGLMSHGEATISFIGEGVSPEGERRLTPFLDIPSGKPLSSDDPKGIVLGLGLAQNLGVTVGAKVVLLANTKSGGVNAVECTVRGLFTTVSKAFDDTALRVPLPIAQQLLRVTGSHRLVLLLDDTKNVKSTVLGLREKFPDSGVEFLPWYELSDFYNKVVTLLSAQISVMYIIIAVIIVLSISNTMMMNVIERTGEIGTSLAIGRSQRQVLRQFIFEGITIGMIGGVIGLLVGWALGAFISWVGIPMPPPPGRSQGYTGEIMITWQLALNTLLLAVTTVLAASLYPAWRASRMQIVDALRHGR